MCTELEQIIAWFSDHDEFLIREKIPRLDKKKMIAALTALKNMVGLEETKKSIVDQVKFLMQNNGCTDGHFLHTIIKGDPGTGKTTLAIVLALIWDALGILEKSNNNSNKNNKSLDVINILGKGFAKQAVEQKVKLSPSSAAPTIIIPQQKSNNNPLNPEEIIAINKFPGLATLSADLSNRATLLKKIIKNQEQSFRRYSFNDLPNNTHTVGNSSSNNNKRSLINPENIITLEKNEDSSQICKDMDVLDLELAHIKDEIKLITCQFRERITGGSVDNRRNSTSKIIDPKKSIISQHFKEQWDQHTATTNAPSVSDKINNVSETKTTEWLPSTPDLDDILSGTEGCGSADDDDDNYEASLGYKIVSRADFVGQYIGSTSTKTKTLLASCRGLVLIVDEIYSLAIGEKDSFGYEALNILCQWMSENAKETIVIGLGYNEAMENSIFAANEGLRRRFGWSFNIEPYTDLQLASIFENQVEGIHRDFTGGTAIEPNNGEMMWILSPEVKHILPDFFKKNKEYFSEQGGDTNNFLFHCKLAHARENWDKLYSITSEKNRKEININILQQAAESFMKSGEKKKKKSVTEIMSMYL